MKLVNKFLGLPPADRLVLMESAFLLVAVRVGLKLLSFHTLLRLLAGMTRALPASQEEDQGLPDRVAWAVAVAKHHLPGVYSCLAQALAAKALLHRRGRPARLLLGVEKGEPGRFQAHAWVENEGSTVVGGEDLSRYRPLPALEW